MSTENDATEFAELLAELEAEQGDDVAEEAALEADVEGDPEADEESEEENEDEDLADEPAEADPEAGRAEIAELFQSGDLKGACEKLGLDPAIFKINNRQFAATRKAEATAKRLKAEADAALATGTSAKAEAERFTAEVHKTYGPMAVGAQAYKNGDPLKARGAIELIFNDTFENIVGSIARAAKGIDPAQLEVQKLRRELAEEKAKKETETTAAQAQATQAAEVTAIAGKLKGTPLDGVDGAAEDIAKIVRASFNPALGRHTKTLKEAFLEVKGVYAKKAAQLAKLAPGVRPAPARDPRAPLPRTPLAPKRAAPKVLSPEDEFKAELEAAKRDTAAQERKLRRTK